MLGRTVPGAADSDDAERGAVLKCRVRPSPPGRHATGDRGADGASGFCYDVSTVLDVLDKAFFVLHTGLIVFNTLGWVWRRTRVPHLVTFGATAFSWFVLGAFYGWGYCVCTDWHFSVRRLGYDDPETSYVQFLVNRLTGAGIGRAADRLGGGVFCAIAAATAVVWIREWRRRPTGTAAGDPPDRPGGSG